MDGEYLLTVAGTGFKNPDGVSREYLIKKFVHQGMPVFLVREPGNQHDPNAIAVYIEAKRLFFFGPYRYQIGYVNKRWAASFTKRMDAGGRIIQAYVRSFHAPEDQDFPRVSIVAIVDWPKAKKKATAT
ncbi:HIRAN domain-containing protein [Pseudomonas anguilliseptica]|uniref:HIRAN domain-containing protein n=1 Tax=Pseudomonas anguilliseptica TaxID=53406 RepID=UPI00325ADD26